MKRFWAVCLLSLLPLLALVCAVVRYHVDVPFSDSWLFASTLEKSYQGTLSLKDLLAPYNDSRPFFPRLLLLGLARASHWDIRWELAANLLAAAGIFAVLARCLWRTAEQTKDGAFLWLIPVASLQVFSMNQAFKWLKGLSLLTFLSEGASVASLALLSRPTLGWRGFSAALSGAVVALFSFSGGVVCWPAGAVALALNDFQGRPVRVLFRRIWWGVGLVLVALCVGFYKKPDHHPSLFFFSEHPISFFRYGLGYFGSPAGFLGLAWAVILGGAALLLWGMAARGLSRLDSAPREVWLPYFSISLYALGNGLVTAIARVGLGEKAALSQRYLNMVNLFWFCPLVLLALWGFYARRLAQTRAVVLGLVLSVMIASSLRGIAAFSRFHAWMEPAREELLTLQDDDVLRRLFPDVEQLRKWAGFLRSQRLSVYREGA